MSFKRFSNRISLGVLALSASLASADNCSGLSDCGGVVTGAAAAAALAVLIATIIRLGPLLTSLAITGVYVLMGSKQSWADGDVAAGGAGGAAKMAFGPGDLTEEAASNLFNIMAAQNDIAFEVPADGCYARAHLMVEKMKEWGLSPGKVWAVSSGRKNDPLWVETENHPDGIVKWGWHVAPTIPVRQADGSVRDMVIDPSLFKHPVTIEEWTTAQHDNPHVRQTKLGEPFPDYLGGSGYWPGRDPKAGPTEHAKKTMKFYKETHEKWLAGKRTN